MTYKPAERKNAICTMETENQKKRNKNTMVNEHIMLQINLSVTNTTRILNETYSQIEIKSRFSDRIKENKFSNILSKG